MDPPLATEGDSLQHSLATAQETAPPGRVVRACARCRKQKLKCDAVRPCTLCRRSQIRCEPQDSGTSPRKGPKKRKRQSGAPAQNASQTEQHTPTQSHLHGETDSPAVTQLSQDSPSERQRFGANSSAVGFAAHIFGNLAASHSSDISSIPGYPGRSTETVTGGSRPWSLATMGCPPPAVLEALLDVFFDRVHWFILIFHEPSFRRSVAHILSKSVWQRDQLRTVLACLTASAVGLLCATRDPSWTGHALLAEASLNARSLLDALIKEVRFHLLDLLDDCCIETVQVCSLLGAYYIYHASPALAWNILGMAVRTAYALALHCDDDEQGYDPIAAQVRRRNWNHITVSDTFAAMIYGRPVSLDTAFSLVQPLYDLDDTSLGPALSGHPLLISRDFLVPKITRLTFHILKFRLYDIIRQALNRFRVLRLQNPISPEDLISLVQAVQHIRSLLETWKSDLPPLFDFEAVSREPVSGDLGSMINLSPEEHKVRRHLSHQILTLQVTYDGAVIFVHRPLLEYRVTADSRQAVPSEALEVAAESLNLSVNAALHMSRIPIAELEKQFVISFVLMNLFTAGVILCIPPITWPLSAIAHEAKAGTLRIIRANRNLKNISHIARHTEQLLTGLLKLSLQLEVDNGLQQDSAGGTEDVNLPPGLERQPLRNLRHAHSRSEKEAQVESPQSEPIPGRTRNSQTRLRTQPERSHSSREQFPAVPDHAEFPLRYDPGIGTNIDLMGSPTDPIYNESHVTSGSDFRWPAMGYGGQRSQVDSQLDETFGAFGQSRS